MFFVFIAAFDSAGRSIITAGPWNVTEATHAAGGGAASTVVNASAARLRCMWLVADAANAVASIYDNASAASGTTLGQLRVATSGETASTPNIDVNAANGLTASVTGGQLYVVWR